MQEADTIIHGADYNGARALSAALVEELDRSLGENTLELPSLPEVALKIRKALADDTVSVSEIARLIGADPALAARILKTANSALFYRGSRTITSVHAAVSQLGHRMVRNVALSFAAQQVFIGYGSPQLRAYLSEIWQHSVHTAALAHMLARVRTKLNPDDAFLAGLLHEVGKLYILMRAKDNVEVLAAEVAFRSVLAAWHPRLGRAVIEAWELPQELANAVGDHQGCRLEAPDPPTMTEVVAVANYLAEQTSTACNDDDFHSKAPNFGSLSMDKPTFDWLIRAGDVDIRLLLLAFGV
jgi:putative nucleotidyltransferase with HDIG domain